MIFLNPIALFGLLVVAIPILLHLLNLRKLRTIEFSTLSFLKELQKTRIRRIKIRQIILLIIRTLIIILLVLTFSRPALKGAFIGGSSSHAKTTDLLLLDNSLSMTARDDQGELFTQAKQSAATVLDLFKEGDDALLLPLSDIAIGKSSDDLLPSRDLNLVRTQLSGLQPSTLFLPLEDGLRAAAKSLTHSLNYNKEVYIFSDFQAGVIPLLRGAVRQENLFPAEARFFLIPLGKRLPQNRGITSINIPTTIFEKDKSVIIKAKISNPTPDPVRNLAASVFFNGTRVAQQGVDIAPGQSSEVQFTVVPTTTGVLEGFVEIEDDELMYDNRRSFTVKIPEQIRLLLVGHPPDLQYLRLAIGTRQVTGRAVFDIQEVTPDRLTPGQLSKAEVVVLTSCEELSSSVVNQCVQYVKEGGGLFIIPNVRMQLQAFNTTMAVFMSIPTIAGIDGTPAAQGQSNENSFVEFSKVEYDHPIFHGMFDENTTAIPRQQAQRTSQRMLESPRISKSLRFANLPSSLALITLSNGSPYLIEQRNGLGSVLLLSTPATLEWSDLPLKGIFVPLIHRSIAYLSQEQDGQQSLMVGSEAVVPIPPGTERWSIQTPTNNEILIKPVKSGDRHFARFGETGDPGVYTLLQGKTIVQKFSVHLYPEETMTGHASQEAIESLLGRLGINAAAVRKIDQQEELSNRILESRFGIELWKECLFAALILALVEMLVARTTKKETLIQES
ncbi:MAG: BatA domain-containing protein [bacterium]